MRGLWLLAVLPVSASALLSVVASDEQHSMSPVSRVVQLLRALSEKIEVESKQEEDLYETYICWGKSVMSQKEASNAAANARIDRLNTYISDLENGRIELTTERVDLEKEIAGLTADIEQANGLREKEEKDYQAAKTEMTQAVDAITRALGVLRTGMGQNLLSVKSNVNGGTLTQTFAARRQESELLQKAVEIGAKVLSKGDAIFLSRVLNADVPVKDWKKLNRKATYKQKYEARSTRIEALLQKLLEDFSADLVDATDKEDAAKKLHDKLMQGKGDQKTKADTALITLDKENGARSMSKIDAIAERDGLATQVIDDTRFMSETKLATEAKTLEWGKRKQLRQDEVAAISEAIGVLHSDDARDLLKRSYSSQGYLFLQQDSAVVAQGQRAQSAADVLRRAAQRAHNRRLDGLAALVSSTHFDKVIVHIDSMLTELQGEEGTELTKKETCESDRATDTRAAIKSAREIDDLSDVITGLETKIEEIKADILEKDESVTKIGEQLAAAETIRQRENADYLVAKQDDDDAIVLVGNAKGVLTAFYADKVFLQRGAKGGKSPVATTAGEAPPPPPATWAADYTGKKQESNGIVAILVMIEDDMKADLASAKLAEEESVKAYGLSKTALDTEKSDLLGEISVLGGQQSTHEGDIVTNKDDRRNKKTDLETTLTKIKDASGYCDYLLVNHAARTANRQIEIDGLTKAKAILKGANFDDQSSQLLQRSPFLRRVSAH